MAEMARLVFGKLSQAWAGEASDFTPLLGEQLDALGDAIGVNFETVGETEVLTAGGRRIDIIASLGDGAEFVIENQYGKADHDHLTRGLAYAVASRARGLVIVAEEHRDEFRAVAEYLNDLAEADAERGIAVWLVEARAVRIDDSPWAPLFTTVAAPNQFTTQVEQQKQSSANLRNLDEFYDSFTTDSGVRAARAVVDGWHELGHKVRMGPNHVVLEAPGPSKNGYRTVVVVYADGRVMVPFHSYAGMNSGIPIDALVDPIFRREADSLFGFSGSEKLARTIEGWLTPDRVSALLTFGTSVATAYAEAPAIADLGADT